MDAQLRKRLVGAPAAPSLLLTVLGEHVLSREHGIWRETLVVALTSLGYSHQTARQAVARSTRQGWLRAERHGRRARMTLPNSARLQLQRSAERMSSFGGRRTWDGRWLVVMLRVPEKNRDTRHQLRSSLASAGLGSLGGGIWVTPHVSSEPEVARALEQESTASGASFVGPLGRIGDPQEIVSLAWNLQALGHQYERFITRFSGARPPSSEACFRELTLMTHAWRRFCFVDPDLPESLLPAHWPQGPAHDLVADRRRRWGPTARRFFLALEDSVPSAARRADVSESPNFE